MRWHSASVGLLPDDDDPVLVRERGHAARRGECLEDARPCVERVVPRPHDLSQDRHDQGARLVERDGHDRIDDEVLQASLDARGQDSRRGPGRLDVVDERDGDPAVRPHLRLGRDRVLVPDPDADGVACLEHVLLAGRGRRRGEGVDGDGLPRGPATEHPSRTSRPAASGSDAFLDLHRIPPRAPGGTHGAHLHTMIHDPATVSRLPRSRPLQSTGEVRSPSPRSARIR